MTRFELVFLGNEPNRLTITALLCIFSWKILRLLMTKCTDTIIKINIKKYFV